MTDPREGAEEQGKGGGDWKSKAFPDRPRVKLAIRVVGLGIILGWPVLMLAVSQWNRSEKEILVRTTYHCELGHEMPEKATKDVTINDEKTRSLHQAR